MNKITPVILGVLAFAPPSFALVSDANSSVKSVTVSIVTSDSNGSGVIIKRVGNKYTVLTAAHVVRDTQKSYSIGTADGQKYPLSNARAFPTGIDLAVVEFTSSKAYPIAKIGNSDDAEEGSGAAVSGYPRSDKQTPVYGFRKGRVVANSNKEFADGYGIVYSSSTLPGMSGGGVFNDRGELIAIHGKGDVTANTGAGSSTVRLKTGYDLGIPINTFTKLAKSTLGITVSQSPAKPQNRPRSGEAFINGMNQFRAKNYAQAITFFDQAIQLDPKDATAHYYRGLCQHHNRNYQVALNDFDRAIALNPQDSYPYMLRAITLMELKQPDKAEADLTKAIQVDPQNSYAYLFRGMVNANPERKKTKQSFADIEQSIKIDPTNADTYATRGVFYLVQKNRPKYLADFRKAMELLKASGDLERYNNMKNTVEVLEKYGSQ
jgi:Tfp pilus assembly protein PilF